MTNRHKRDVPQGTGSYAAIAHFFQGRRTRQENSRYRRSGERSVRICPAGSGVSHEIFINEDLRLVDIDEGQISQVIHNLVINADHAMPQGGVITIRCSNVRVESNSLHPLKEGDYVRISIEDHGVGIPKERVAKIFDPYFTTKQKGSGLGLATAYSIIQKHGGHISVESTLGAGTVFSVYLPASRGQTALRQANETLIYPGAGSILLMDDEADVRETTGKVLMKLGYRVEYASDGKEAIEMYTWARDCGKSYDLVIMDLTVPGGMGGKETIQNLHEIDPGILAIVSSGYSNDPVIADFKAHGFAGVVSKPYRLKDLSAEVHKVLRGQR